MMHRWKNIFFFSVIILASTHSWSEGLKSSLSKKQENLAERKKKFKDSGLIYRKSDGSYEKIVSLTKEELEELEELIPSFPEPTKYKGLKGTLEDGTVFFITRKADGEGRILIQYTNKQCKKKFPKKYKKMEWWAWRDKTICRFCVAGISISMVTLAYKLYEIYTRKE